MNYNKKVITGMLIFLFLFVCVMVCLGFIYQYEQETLIKYVFGFCGLEGGYLAWIKTTDTKKGDKDKDD